MIRWNPIIHMDTALFSPSSLFGDDSDDENEQAITKEQELFVERIHRFPGLELKIREFSFHHLNANLLWPGTFAFSEWLLQNQAILHGQRILELGSGTGALAIFLRLSFGVDITTSDYDDEEIEKNIAYNCEANKLDILPHIRHTWGDPFPFAEPHWDLIIASDILLYVKEYLNLIKTVCFLLKTKNSQCLGANHHNTRVERVMKNASGAEVAVRSPMFIMSWRRRIGEEDTVFFDGCEQAGLAVQHLGSRVYCITQREDDCLDCTVGVTSDLTIDN